MTDTNAARQAKFKAQLREKGLRQIAVWVSDEQAAAIKAYLAGDAAALAPAAPSAKRRQGAPSSGRLMAPAGSALPTSKPNESGATDAATTPRFAGDAAKLADAPPPPIVVANDITRTRKRKKRKASADELLLEKHRPEILARIERGEKPSAIVAWLRHFGYQGRPTEFNYTFGWYIQEAYQEAQQAGICAAAADTRGQDPAVAGAQTQSPPEGPGRTLPRGRRRQGPTCPRCHSTWLEPVLGKRGGMRCQCRACGHAWRSAYWERILLKVRG